MESICTLRFRSPFHLQPSIRYRKLHIPSNVVVFSTELAGRLNKQSWNRRGMDIGLVSGATGDSDSLMNSDENRNTHDEFVVVDKGFGQDPKDPLSRLRSLISSSLPPVVFVLKRHAGNSILVGVSVATALLVIAVRMYVVRKSRPSRPGSVSDLVRRGQLRSDRRGISKPLKYEDPFNNPFMKVGKSSSTIEMCGKTYRLAPVTLTEKERAMHQKRRSRAYQWKRPTVFLKEGDSIPSDVDPDTVRWIPANHPFATTASEIDEDLAQNNVYQKHGVPFRIQAEHEALQRKLEALQGDEKFNNLVIDSRNARDFQRSFKFSPKSDEASEKSSSENQAGNLKPSKQEPPRDSARTNSSSEEAPKA